MRITLIEINSLNPAEYNPRQINNKQYEDLKASMEKFGCVDPIIININPERLNVVVGGHQRLRILRELGAEKVPTVSVNLSEEDERELNVRLNKSGGDWDIDLLSNFDVVDLKEWGFKDIELGFNIDKIDEDKPITITVKEDDAVLANELYEDLKGKGYKVTIK
jgi:ParB-like chromosome segregation protein Spo0J|tara:strand:+ start:416 stop:907 length:492 start_codon:yes stop_codon:yes gene_type:complete